MSAIVAPRPFWAAFARKIFPFAFELLESEKDAEAEEIPTTDEPYQGHTWEDARTEK